MVDIAIPRVKFSGVVMFSSGMPMQGTVTLYPEALAFTWGDHLFTTCSYTFELGEDGSFDVEVFPTNLGVATPWKYCMVLPDGRSVDVGLPLGGPHSLNALMDGGTA